jgi:hypothetical protein
MNIRHVSSSLLPKLMQSVSVTSSQPQCVASQVHTKVWSVVKMMQMDLDSSFRVSGVAWP